MPTPRNTTAIRALALTAWALLGTTAGADPIAIAYDLDFDGPETSTVEECPRLGPCTIYPIVGQIEVTLGPITPTLRNLNSQILIPPDVPGSESVAIWENLEILVGEYTSDALLTDAASADVSMRFAYPLDDAPNAYYELYVELTNGRADLALTGGFIGVALASDLNSVAFNVLGHAVPEPTTLVLGVVAFAGAAGIGRRRSGPRTLTQAVLR